MADDIEADKNDLSNAEIVKKRPLSLYDLPELILERMKGELPLVDCLVLRKVSKSLRSFVDSSKAHCQTLKFLFGPDSARMTLDNLELEYKETGDGGCMVTSNRKDTQNTKTYRDDRNVEQASINDASTFLKMPKLEIGHIELEFSGDGELIFWKLLKSLNHRLHVKTIRSRELEILSSVQKFMNPAALDDCFYPNTYHVSQLTQCEYFSIVPKNPKLTFEEVSFNDYSDRSAAKFSEMLKSNDSKLNIRRISVLDGRWIPLILQFVNLEKVDHVFITDELTLAQFKAIAANVQWKRKTRLSSWCKLPIEVGIEQVMDFKMFLTISKQYMITEENLLIIRDNLLKSSHLELLELLNRFEEDEEMRDDMNAIIDNIMSVNPSYDAATRRFSIPNSRDYFQLKFVNSEKRMHLSIWKMSPEHVAYYLSSFAHLY